MRLPLHALAALAGLDLDIGALGLSPAFLGLCRLFLLPALGFHDHLRDVFSREDGGRIPGDVTDQALSLRGLDHGCM